MLWERIVPGNEYRKSQAYLTTTLLRLNLVDEICGSVSCALGHLGSFGHPDSVIIKVYSLVWPLFFAGRCLLEDGRYYSLSSDKDGLRDNSLESSTNRFLWIVAKLRYIHKELGLSWVGGMLGVLARDSRVHGDFYKLQSSVRQSPCPNTESTPCPYGVPEWYESGDGDETPTYAIKQMQIRWSELEEEPSIVSYV